MANSMTEECYEMLQDIKNQIESRVEYHLKSGDYDTADAIMNEFYEWFTDEPCEVIGVTVF